MPLCVTSIAFKLRAEQLAIALPNGEFRVIAYRKAGVLGQRVLVLTSGSTVECVTPASESEMFLILGHISEVMRDRNFTISIGPETCGVECPTDQQRTDGTVPIPAGDAATLPDELSKAVLGGFKNLSTALRDWLASEQANAAS
jgi:hypothetical protein